MIGIIPAAGHATRLYGLPKFLLPVPGGLLVNILCNRMLATGAIKIIVRVNSQNCDITKEHLLPGIRCQNIDTYTMSQTVLWGFKIPYDGLTLFGMPDTYWLNEDVYPRLVSEIGDAIASVALWYTLPQYRSKRGMVELDKQQRIIRVVDKPENTDLRFGWGAMAWQPAFWTYIKAEDPHVGFALQRAIEAGETVQGVVFDNLYFDCGTPEEYFHCINYVSGCYEPTRSLTADRARFQL